MIKDLLKKYNLQDFNWKKLNLDKIDFSKIKFLSMRNIILAVCLLIIVFGGYSLFSTPVKNAANKDMVLTIKARGTLPDLTTAMEGSGALSSRIKKLVSYDVEYVFTNYREVNSLVSEAMFLWSGISEKEIKKKSKQDLVEDFIRRVYQLPQDEPIKNSPFLEKYPWPSLFQNIKSKILMQGNGYKIFDGTAYYNSEKDLMVVEGGLSYEFIENFAAFIKGLPVKDQKGFRDNYLIFVDETLGLKNISEEERAVLKAVGFL